MNLKKYSEAVSKLAELHPDVEVVYAIDPEGNAFHSVDFGPTLGMFEDGEWIPEDNFEDEIACAIAEDFEPPKLKVNSVCIN